MNSSRHALALAAVLAATVLTAMLAIVAGLAWTMRPAGTSVALTPLRLVVKGTNGKP